MTDVNGGWVPEACTLPTEEQPLRLEEFDHLFATALWAQTRVSDTVLRWSFDLTSEATARDLAARESTCCSLFVFDLTATDRSLQVNVRVPPAQIPVLNALAARTAAGIGSR